MREISSHERSPAARQVYKTGKVRTLYASGTHTSHTAASSNHMHCDDPRDIVIGYRCLKNTGRDQISRCVINTMLMVSRSLQFEPSLIPPRQESWYDLYTSKVMLRMQGCLDDALKSLRNWTHAPVSRSINILSSTYALLRNRSKVPAYLGLGPLSESSVVHEFWCRSLGTHGRLCGYGAQLASFRSATIMHFHGFVGVCAPLESGPPGAMGVILCPYQFLPPHSLPLRHLYARETARLCGWNDSIRRRYSSRFAGWDLISS